MQHMLDVGGSRGDALDTRRRPAVRGVRRLNDGDMLVAGLFELIDEPDAIVAQQHGIGVQREHVFGVAQHEIGHFPRPDVTQHHAVGGFLTFDAVTHQPDERVEVHRLVAFLRQGDVLLALERPAFDGEDPYEPVVQLHDTLGGDRVV